MSCMEVEALPLRLGHLAMYADDREVAVIEQTAELSCPAHRLDEDHHLQTYQIDLKKLHAVYCKHAVW